MVTPRKPGAVRGRPRVPHRPHVATRLSQADYARLLAHVTPPETVASLLETAVLRYLDLLDRRKSSAK